MFSNRSCLKRCCASPRAARFNHCRETRAKPLLHDDRRIATASTSCSVLYRRERRACEYSDAPSSRAPALAPNAEQFPRLERGQGTLKCAIVPTMEAAMSDSEIDWSKCPDVERVPGRVSGRWVVKDSRILADGIIENFDAGA